MGIYRHLVLIMAILRQELTAKLDNMAMGLICGCLLCYIMQSRGK